MSPLESTPIPCGAMNLPGSSPSSGCPNLHKSSPLGFKILILWPRPGGIGFESVGDSPHSSPMYIFLSFTNQDSINLL